MKERKGVSFSGIAYPVSGFFHSLFFAGVVCFFAFLVSFRSEARTGGGSQPQ